MSGLSASLLDQLLLEDAPYEDLTTLALGIGSLPGRMDFRARDRMIIAGIDIAADLIRKAGAQPSVLIPPGSPAPAGALLLSAEGPAAALHLSWKMAQTLTEILSGIATAARVLVDTVEAIDRNVRVACTRKTMPKARLLSMMAIKAGGAIPHRLGLSETVLVFPEHRAFLPGVSFQDIADRLRKEAPEKKIAIEVVTVEEARKAIEARFDIVQLEKMLPGEVAEVHAIATVSPHPTLLAAAGGISPGNAGAYVKAGAGLIVSSWPYTAKPADITVTITPKREI